LSIVTNEAYKEKMEVFDPAFSVPGAKKLRTMIGKSYSFNKEALREIFQQKIDYVSLTTDFWTSRAKHGYLGVTASFITTDFSIVDIMLDIKYVPAPHTAVVIADSLYECILDWNLSGRVVSIVTDNGANMVASIRLLNEKPGCCVIKRLPCVSHTLQLAIGKGLMLAEVLVARVRRIINFFSTQKQVERLKNVQKHLGYTETLQLVQDVSTRWNSSYYAFDRLFFLKDAIIQLQADLCTSTNREEKKDGNKLRKIMLSDGEWDLVDELITLLMPFEQATCEFSGGSYVTLSKMMPTIKELIFNLGDFYEISLLDETTTSEFNDLYETNSIPDIDDEEVLSNYSRKKISIKYPINTINLLNKIKEKIYNSLIYYWNGPNDLGLLATLLDPRYKNLDCIDDENEKQQLIQQLYIEYNELKPESNTNQNENQIVDLTNDISLTRSYQGYKHHRLLKGKRKNVLSKDHYLLDEVKSYLELSLAPENENPLEWWKVRMQAFPYLSKLALKYLSIPASSVSSERLFSDAGNIINQKRTRLNCNLVAKMLFLKRNMKFMNVFAPNWDANEDIESE
jgi:zinc finger BED domain-containing protein 1 (E3 SUMO-protein ligase ZBED1)